MDEIKAHSGSVFDLVSTGGAKGLRRRDLVTIEKGKKADFLIIDVSHPSNYPIQDYINHVVLKASEKAVLKKFVSGKHMYVSKQQSFDKMFPTIPT